MLSQDYEIQRRSHKAPSHAPQMMDNVGSHFHVRQRQKAVARRFFQAPWRLVRSILLWRKDGTVHSPKADRYRSRLLVLSDCRSSFADGQDGVITGLIKKASATSEQWLVLAGLHLQDVEPVVILRKHCDVNL